MQRQQTVPSDCLTLFTPTSSTGSSRTPRNFVKLPAHCPPKIALQATSFQTSALMQKARAFSTEIHNPTIKSPLHWHQSKLGKDPKHSTRLSVAFILFSILSVYGSSSISLHSNSTSIPIPLMEMLIIISPLTHPHGAHLIRIHYQQCQDLSVNLRLSEDTSSPLMFFRHKP